MWIVWFWCSTTFWCFGVLVTLFVLSSEHLRMTKMRRLRRILQRSFLAYCGSSPRNMAMRKDLSRNDSQLGPIVLPQLCIWCLGLCNSHWSLFHSRSFVVQQSGQSVRSGHLKKSFSDGVDWAICWGSIQTSLKGNTSRPISWNPGKWLQMMTTECCGWKMAVFANDCGEKNKLSLISLGAIRLDLFEQWQEFQVIAVVYWGRLCLALGISYIQLDDWKPWM